MAETIEQLITKAELAKKELAQVLADNSAKELAFRKFKEEAFVCRQHSDKAAQVMELAKANRDGAVAAQASTFQELQAQSKTQPVDMDKLVEAGRKAHLAQEELNYHEGILVEETEKARIADAEADEKDAKVLEMEKAFAPMREHLAEVTEVAKARNAEAATRFQGVVQRFTQYVNAAPANLKQETRVAARV